jgi:hypothetical protein
MTLSHPFKVREEGKLRPDAIKQNRDDNQFFVVASRVLRSSEFELPQQSKTIRVSFLMNRTPTGGTKVPCGTATI